MYDKGVVGKYQIGDRRLVMEGGGVMVEFR